MGLRYSLGLVLFLLCSACSGGESADGDVDAGMEPDGGVSYSDGDWLFDEDRLLRIEVEMAEAGWDELRFQTRTILDIFGEGCGISPVPSPFTYFSASVTIEDETFDKVGIRKKGFLGSLSTDKPSLKIKMDEYVLGQKMSGLKRFTLNNSVQDPSYLNQCLGYQLFRAAGLPAPRCNFAKVVVNGVEMGVYVHVESVKKPFLRAHFGSDTGNLYEGTLSDFRDGWTGTFDKKTNELEADWLDIEEMRLALEQEGEALLSALSPLVNLDQFIKFWALEVLVAHWDGYAGNSNNYFVYDDPESGLFHFMPWGADQLFGDGSGQASVSVSRSILPNKLISHAPTRSRYVEAMTELLDTVWEDSDVAAEIARMEGLLRPHILDEEMQAFDEGLVRLRAAVNGREAELRSQLGDLEADPGGDPMPPLCFAESGSVSGSFATTFNGGGTALMQVVLDGAPIVYSQESSFVGPTENPGEVVIAVFGDLPDQSRTLLFITLGEDELSPGSIAFDQAVLLTYPPNSDEPSRFDFASGTLSLTEASTSAGQPVAGSVDLVLWQSWF